MRIRRLGPADEAAVHAAAALFDAPPREDATRRFLSSDNHHLLIAYTEDGAPAGFISGVEITQPDKGTEMFLYELGVEPPYRRRGIGRALVEALGALARERGCSAMFVLTEPDNVAALATYAGEGVVREDGSVMFTWEPPPG